MAGPISKPKLLKSSAAGMLAAGAALTLAACETPTPNFATPGSPNPQSVALTMPTPNFPIRQEEAPVTPQQTATPTAAVAADAATAEPSEPTRLARTGEIQTSALPPLTPAPRAAATEQAAAATPATRTISNAPVSDPAAAAPSRAYVVKLGDTLFSIGRRFGVSPDEIARLNNIRGGTSILEDQRLLMPANIRDRGVLPAAQGRLVSAPNTAPVQLRPSLPAPPLQNASRPPAAAQPTSPPVVTTAQAPAPVTRAPVAATPPIARPAPSAPVTPAIIATAPSASEALIRTAGAGRFVWPLQGRVLHGYGPTGDGQRVDGLKIAGPMEASVRAAAPGRVLYAGSQIPEFGNLVLIEHPGGFVTAYGHLSKTSVRMNDQISQNQEIGHVGTSGGAAQPQLHFEVRYAQRPGIDRYVAVDPMLVLPSGQ